MSIDNSTGKNKEFYDLGKKMFDRLNPHIAHNPKVVGPVQEPVAWMNPSWIDPDTRGWQSDSFESLPIEGWLPLYTTPPQRIWVYLTDEEIDKAWRSCDYTVPWEQHRIDLARAIEAKLKEKNT